MTFLAVLVLFILSGPVTNYLETVVFAWLPNWFVQDTGLEGGEFSKSALLLVNVASIFFALYHFTTPWGLVFRFLSALVLAYSAYRKQNLLPAIIVHFIVNSVDVIMGFAYILNM